MQRLEIKMVTIIGRYPKQLLIITIFFVLTGCQSKENIIDAPPQEDITEAPQKDRVTKAEDVSLPLENDSDEEKSRVSLEAPPLPKTLEEVVQYPVGMFKSQDGRLTDAAKKQLSLFPTLSEEAGDDELMDLYARIYSLVKSDYEDPIEILEMVTNEKPVGEMEQPQQEVGSYNLVIALDASGSMANKIGAKTRMELAKEAIESFVSKLPKEANVGLRVYGHKGTGTSADKALSCASNELVYPIQPYSDADLKTALGAFNPAGWTPLASAIEEAQKDLNSYQGENDHNVVFIVSDGVETCDGDPVKAAANLKDSGISQVVHIIGFDVKNSEQQQLKDVAEAAGGTYTNVKDHRQLQQEFDKTIQDAVEWQKWYLDEWGDVQMQYFDQSKLMSNFYYDFSKRLSFENSRVQYAIFELSYQKTITSHQKTILMNKREHYYKDINSQLTKMKKLFDTANRNNYYGTKNELREIYYENVSN